MTLITEYSSKFETDVLISNNNYIMEKSVE